MYILPGRILQDKIYRAGNGAAVQPSICVDSQSLPAKFLDMAWFLYGLQKPVQTYRNLSEKRILGLITIPPDIPLIPIVDTVRGTGGSSFSDNGW